MNAGVLKGLSIGYDSVKDRVENGVRRLSELKLWEISLVTCPMNPAAQVTGVKNFEDIGKEIRTFRAELSPSAAKASGVKIHSETAIRMVFAEFKSKWDVALAATS